MKHRKPNKLESIFDHKRTTFGEERKRKRRDEESMKRHRAH